MPTRHSSGLRSAIDPALLLLGLFMGLCWFAGGASRGDVLGQTLVRGGAGLAMIAALLWCRRPDWQPVRSVVIFVLLALLLVILQLIPLPPGFWQSLPGRAMIAEAAGGHSQPWRPWSMTPGATLNAAASLMVPIAVLVLVAGLGERGRGMLPGIVLALIAAGMFVGLLQVIGAGFGNSLINDTPGEVSGMFANRNHFALFLALGCLIAPVWAFATPRVAQWRAMVALGLLLLFVMTILASGSRAGMAIGGLAAVLGLLLANNGIRRALRRAPRWVVPALLLAVVGLIGGVVLIAILADRAESINRVLAVDTNADMRRRALPVVFEMVKIYFPVGTGIGGFDTMFRVHEPFALLKPTYFNHAHNDFLEIALDAGLPGLVLLSSAILWWLHASVRAWRSWRDAGSAQPLLGSAMILLILIASVFDYPARTPMIMVMMVVAATWLSRGSYADTARRPAGGSPLPDRG